MNPTTDLTKSTLYTEGTLCGSLLLDTDMIPRVAHIVAPEDFSHARYGKLYSVIIKQWKQGLTVDPALVASDLSEDEADLPYECVEAVGTAVNAPHLAEKIADAASRRKVQLECQKGIKAAAVSEDSVTSIIGGVQDRLAGVMGLEDVKNIEEQIIQLQLDSERAAKQKDGVPGISTGYKVFDKVIGGLTTGGLIVLGARASVGKTAWGLNIIDNISHDDSIASAVFSCEMQTKELLLRFIAREAGLDLSSIRRGDLSPEEWVRYTAASQVVSERISRNVLISDKPRVTLGYVSSVVRNMQRTRNVKVVLLDYLQLLGTEGRHESRVTELSALTAGCKELAKELDVAVILLSQINRQAETGQAMDRPNLAQLKGTSGAEDDADVVVLIHREYRDSPMAELIVAKNRSGQTGKFKLAYDGPTCTFKEIK